MMYTACVACLAASTTGRNPPSEFLVQDEDIDLPVLRNADGSRGYQGSGYLERLALGTPYPAAAERAAKITRSGEMAGRCTLVVDATGVGRPVVDLLKRERPGCTLMPVNITGWASESKNGGYYGVPKRDLVTGVQVLLQSGGLQIASGIPHGAALVAEMADMRAKVTSAGNTQFGVWREGAHDDLVLAVALACWAARRKYPHGPSGAAEYWKRAEQGDWERGMKGWAQGMVV